VSLIDLERWSETALQPRDAYFVDSVHLTEVGEEKIGKYMAQELMLTLANSAKPVKSSNTVTHYSVQIQ